MKRERLSGAFWGILDALRGMGRGRAEALGLCRMNEPKLAERKGKPKA